MIRRRTLGLLVSAALATACSSAPGADTSTDAGATTCPTATHQLDDGSCDATLTWSTVGAIPTARDHHVTFLATVPSGTFLYVMGGAASHMASSVKKDILRATVNTSDGTLGEWESIGEMPVGLAGHGVALVDRTLVIAGGFGTNGIVATSRVAKLGDDGTFSEWTTGPTFSSPRFHETLMARGNRLYSIGGALGTAATDDVVTATVSEDGTVSDWTTVTKLPDSRSHHSAFIRGNWIYVMGGLRGNPSANPTTLKDIIRTDIKDDGTLGEWTEVGELAVDLATNSAVVHNDWLYVIGGIESNATFTDHVSRAPLHSDGSLGEWQDSAALPKGRGHVHQTPVLNDTWIYSVAGSTPTGTLKDAFIGRFE